MPAMPRWLLPWLVPLGVVAGLVAVAVSVWLVLVVVLVVLLGAGPYLRLQYLKQHPPDPELRHRNFWDLR